MNISAVSVRMRALYFCAITLVCVSVISACGSNSEIDTVNNQSNQAINKNSELPAAMLSPTSQLKEVGSTAVESSQNIVDQVPLSTLPPTVPVRISLGSGSEEDAKKVALKNQSIKNSVVPKRYQLGYQRQIARGDFAKANTTAWQWTPVSNGGHTASLIVDSGDAKAVRLGLLIGSLPEDVTLVVSAPGAVSGQYLTGRAINQVIQANLSAGDTSDSGRTLWMPTVDGAVVQLQMVLPKSVNPDAVKVTLTSVSHQIETVKSAYENGYQMKASGSCNVDAACTVPLPAVANSVALMAFVNQGVAYTCTGTLLNDSASTKLPYFLTAEHCIENQTAASTLETLWFYRKTACGGTLYATAVGLTGLNAGAKLLYTDPWETGADTALLLLNHSAPAGAHHAAWSAEVLLDPQVMGLHHPQSDVLKLSRGSAQLYNSSDIRVTWTSGTTESGSSGSSLFNSSNQVVGNLSGGSASCTNTTGVDYYGRFDYGYNKAMKAWLNTKNSTLVPVKTRLLGDFNGDGKVDLIWRTTDGLVNIALMNGGMFSKWVNLGKYASNVAIMGVGDFNGDGISDIVWRNMSTGAVSISVMNASAQISTTLAVGVSPIALNVALEGIGDFDGNGRADMLWRNTTTGRSVLSYHRTDGSVESWPVVSNFIDPVRTTAHRVGDINGDGKDDIVWRNAVTGNVVISLMNGAVPTWIGITASPIPPTTVIEAVADFDGNGRADILWRNTLTGRSLMSYHNSDGSVSAWPVVSNNISTIVSALGAGDFDGDGKADIVWRNLSTGNTVISLMNGNIPYWLTLAL